MTTFVIGLTDKKVIRANPLLTAGFGGGMRLSKTENTKLVLGGLAKRGREDVPSCRLDRPIFLDGKIVHHANANGGVGAQDLQPWRRRSAHVFCEA